ncbi:MAG: M3 family metallopeptidase, partial [Acetobacteraceae bacterium]
VFTLSRSSAEPFLTFSARRDLREKLWRGFAARGALTEGRENAPLIRDILKLRRERAQLLGEADFASFRLRDTMAGSPDAAEALLRACWEPAKRRIAVEKAELEDFARAAGHNGPIEPWDWRHWAERARQAKHNFDGAALKPYFELEAMLRAMFDTARRLFGLVFEERADIPRYHADLRGFEALDAAGNHVGLLLLDNYARPGKRSGAWMNSYRVADRLGEGTAPIIINNNNVARATPTLLSFDEARTLFHEFGHALHGMLSDVTYPSQSGTNVKRDFVEFPSQLMEHWVTTPEILTRFAKHYATGEVIPRPLVDKIIAAKNFNQGWATSEFMMAAIMDMKMHMIEGSAPTNVDAWENEILSGIGAIPEIVVRYRPGYFKHTFEGGYAAGYYSYIWAAVLECDAFQAFVEAGNVYDPATSKKLQDFIFASGGQADPMDNYVAFRGRAPGVEAL